MSFPLYVLATAIHFLIRFILLTGIKCYYIPGEYNPLNIYLSIHTLLGKQSYKLWQTKFAICLLITGIILFFYTIIVVELSHIIFINFDFNNITKVRLVKTKRISIYPIIYILGSIHLLSSIRTWRTYRMFHRLYSLHIDISHTSKHISRLIKINQINFVFFLLNSCLM